MTNVMIEDWTLETLIRLYKDKGDTDVIIAAVIIINGDKQDFLTNYTESNTTAS